jgi:hypothetical protein
MLLTLFPALIILYNMKSQVRIAGFALLFAVLLACASEPGPKSDEALVRYLAGVDLIAADTSLPAAKRAGMYKRLCVITGIDAAKAQLMVRRYAADPEAWQRLQSEVAAVLDKRK